MCLFLRSILVPLINEISWHGNLHNVFLLFLKFVLDPWNDEQRQHIQARWTLGFCEIQVSPLNCWKHLWRFIRGVNRLILKLESVHSIIPTCVYHPSLQYDFNSTSRTPENKNKTLKSLKKETKTQNTNTKSPEHEHEDLRTRTRRPQNTNTKTLEHEREDPKTRKPRLNNSKMDAPKTVERVNYWNMFWQRCVFLLVKHRFGRCCMSFILPRWMSADRQGAALHFQ